MLQADRITPNPNSVPSADGYLTKKNRCKGLAILAITINLDRIIIEFQESFAFIPEVLFISSLCTALYVCRTKARRFWRPSANCTKVSCKSEVQTVPY